MKNNVNFTKMQHRNKKNSIKMISGRQRQKINKNLANDQQDLTKKMSIINKNRNRHTQRKKHNKVEMLRTTKSAKFFNKKSKWNKKKKKKKTINK